MASSVTSIEFQNALDRYPSLLKKISGEPKNGRLSLEELDEFRYNTAPTKFCQSTEQSMKISDLKMLIEWKMRHGTFRPALMNLVSSNSEDDLATATKNAFEFYTENKDDIAGTLERITKPLRGIGPAAGSLILSIHDPENIVYFSDELYRWLCTDGNKVSLGYTVKEFEKLHDNAKAFIARIKCTPIELEKVAYVFIREEDLKSDKPLEVDEDRPSPPNSEKKPTKSPSGRPRGRPSLPESEKKPKKSPSGRPRGRPSLPESEKKTKKSPSGRPRGRPALPESEKKPKKLPSGRPRGRPALPESEKKSKKVPSGRPRGRPALPESEKKARNPPSGRPRGRPPLAESAKRPIKQPSGRPRGRPSKAVTRLIVVETTELPSNETEANNREVPIDSPSNATNEDIQKSPARRKRKASNIADSSNKMAKHLIQVSCNS